ncbi:MAG: polyhydroxyalkanoate synthesis regulator DNA-binding domain-containing protein [Myxococcales bacterium]
MQADPPRGFWRFLTPYAGRRDNDGVRHDGDQKEAPEAAPAGGTGAATDPKIIKRYTNRKLYDTVESRYVTLDEIGEMIKRGVEVRIVDNKSKDDLTSVTLAQIIFEEEKKKSRMPLGMLRDIIRSGGERLEEFIQKEVTPRVSSLREGAEAGLKLLKRESAERPRELFGATQVALQEWQHRVDERIREGLARMTSLPSLGSEQQKLGERLAELEKKIDEFEKQEK